MVKNRESYSLFDLNFSDILFVDREFDCSRLTRHPKFNGFWHEVQMHPSLFVLLNSSHSNYWVCDECVNKQIISKLTANTLIDSPNAMRFTISEWTVRSVALWLMNNKSICLCNKETFDVSTVFDEMYWNKISEYLMALLKRISCHFANISLLLR